MSERWYEFNRSNPSLVELDLRGVIGLGEIEPRDFADELRAVDSPRLRVNINSPGGEVSAGIDIYNQLRGYADRGGTVETYNAALAASIASVIMLAGDRRIAAPHSRMMVHEAMTMAAGRASDFESTAVRLRDLTSTIAAIYAERTGKAVAYWLPLMESETWFSDAQALEQGFATEIGRGYDARNFVTASSFATLNQYRAFPGFDPEVMTAPAEHRCVCGAADGCPMGESNTTNTAAPAPEGDPAPSLPPQEQAKAEIERRLARIRL